ncbi:DUF2905 domain-containing protein [Noviherbaspirillum galbum]|uniref:DUF2905 domain-containing protein n=1 Tax=Noviherbaspirillum galbum TaxID=2709383 RepID=A0A6B3SYM4_9BURK|nr:DUF2905 domain-containing protein [Noviherbaspirillum galbum]NEX63149.1 DUF2905 domain-containing protein [Noviherbaspirillum galbum]
MIRWVAVIFLGLAVFYPLLPQLDALRVGRLPGDVRFKVRGIVFCLPFGSTVLWSIIALIVAEIVKLSAMP